MKGEIVKDITNRKFQPIKVVLKVDCLEDARLLYHVFNDLKLREHLERGGYPMNLYSNCSPALSGDGLYGIIRCEIKERGFEI